MPNYDINTMTKADYDTLMKELASHAHAYYVDDAPTISDNEYDAMYRIAKKVEALHPEWAETHSVVSMETIVADLEKSGHQKVKHSAPMLSLDNAMNEDEARAFHESVAKLCGHDVEYIKEYKFDGLGLSALYIDGKLVQALTRGDGTTGENVLVNAQHLKGLPLSLPDSAPARLEVRGEVLMSKSRLEALNAKAAKEGTRGLANVRNAAAGALRALEPSTVLDRELFFRAYSCPNVSDELPQVKSQSELLTLLATYGFAVDEWQTGKGFAFIQSTFADVVAKRDTLDFAIDGVVYKVNQFSLQDLLGWRSRVPNFAKAYKFQSERVHTKLLAIDIQIGKSGQATPVARVAPAFVGGVEVSNVTLATFNSLNSKGVRVGDMVILQRAGEVIPEIIGYDPEARPEDAVPFEMPTNCPHCGSPITQERNTTLYFCRGGLSCEPQRIGKIIHYASREALNIEGLGSQTCYQLHNAGMLDSFADIYRLKEEEIAKLPGFGKSSAKKLVKAIEAAKRVPIDKFIYALSIDNVGSNTSKILANAYGSLEVVRSKEYSDFYGLTDIGDITATSLVQYFHPDNSQHLDDLLQYVEVVPLEKESELLKDKSFVITGTLSQGREVFKALIEKNGGKVSSGVSKKTNYLIAGENAGDKLEKAQALGVSVLTEAEFWAMLK